MKFKDKNGNVFIPTSPDLENKMKKSKLYEEVKTSSKGKEANDNK